jgi:hypothetical protein
VAGSFSDFLENELLDHVFGAAAYTAPATIYLALLTAAPTDASTGSTITEANYTGYVRKSMTNNKTTFSTAASGALNNAAAITFAQCTAGSSTVTHFAILDAASAGNILAWGDLTVSKSITAGDIPEFAAASLSISLN